MKHSFDGEPPASVANDLNQIRAIAKAHAAYVAAIDKARVECECDASRALVDEILDQLGVVRSDALNPAMTILERAWEDVDPDAMTPEQARREWAPVVL
jgi:hypothetical protein